MKTADSMGALKSLIRSRGKHYMRLDYVRAWLAGEISDAEYLKRSRDALISKGYVKASGSWWPQYLVDGGALRIVERDDTRVIPVMTSGTEEIPEKDESGRETGKKVRVVKVHPLLAEWFREERKKERVDAYMDTVA